MMGLQNQLLTSLRHQNTVVSRLERRRRVRLYLRMKKLLRKLMVLQSIESHSVHTAFAQKR